MSSNPPFAFGVSGFGQAPFGVGVNVPNVIGLLLKEAELVFQQSGALSLTSLGYFSAWPIRVTWTPSKSPPSTVLGQTPPTIQGVNFPIFLTCAEFPMGVVYP